MATHTSTELMWVRYAPRTMLINTTGLSFAAELAHRRLADFAWSEMPWLAPDSPAFLLATRLTRGDVAAVLIELKSAGWRIRNKTISHPGLQAVIDECRATQAAARARSSAANAVRWKKSLGTIGQDRPSPASPPGTPQGLLKESQATILKDSQAAILEESYTDRQTDRQIVQTDRQTEKDLKRLTAERLTVASPVEAVSRFSGSPPLPGGTAEADPNACRPGALTRRPDLHGGTAEAPNPTAEKEFLAELLTVLERYSPASAEAELTNWGGWWRNAFRTDPDKSRRVLADTNNMISEGRITSNPGAAAADLWRRLPS